MTSPADFRKPLDKGAAAAETPGMKLSQSRAYIVDDDGSVASATEVWAEIERLTLKRREQFNRWGVEIRYYDQKQLALKLERAEAEVERLREIDRASFRAWEKSEAEVERLRDVERLAAIQHDIWSHWMRWFFDNDTPENRERWKRQMATTYAELSESERESDRRVVRTFCLSGPTTAKAL